MRVFDFLGPNGTGFNGCIATAPNTVTLGGDVADAGQYVGFAIGAESDISECRVDGKALTLGYLLPWRGNRSTPKFEPVRSFCTGGNTSGDPTGKTDSTFQVNARLQIYAYEPGDALSAPGPRQPKRLRDVRDWNGVATYQRIFRAPMQGRRNACWFVDSPSAPGAFTFTYVVEKVRYRDRDLLLQGANNPYGVALTALDPQRSESVGPSVINFPLAALDGDGSTKQGSIGVLDSDPGEQIDEIWIWAKSNVAVPQVLAASLVVWD